jgi:hypothetical protein
MFRGGSATASATRAKNLAGDQSQRNGDDGGFQNASHGSLLLKKEKDRHSARTALSAFFA